MNTRTAFVAVLLATLAFELQAQTIFKDPFEAPVPVTLRVEITPGSQLFTGSDQSTQLSARVLDLDGKEVAAEISWRSTDDATVQIDQTGFISSLALSGSAQIIAESPGASPAIALVVIAQPAQGAVLITDSQVAEGPTAIDSETRGGLGFQYEVMLTDVVDIEPGTLVLSTESSPVAGRVTTVNQEGPLTRVALEVVSLAELFDDLVIDQTFSISKLPIDLDPEFEKLFSATRYKDGNLILTPNDSIGKAPQGTSLSQIINCEDSSVTSWQNILTVTTNSNFAINPTISVDVVYDRAAGGLQRLIANGSLSAVMELKPRTRAAFEGKIKCKIEVGQIQIPLAGPFSWIFSGQVPLGVGLEISGKVSTTAEAGYDLTAVGNANFETGIQCDSGCLPVDNLTIGFSGTGKPVVPSVDALLGGFQLDITGHLFAYADLSFGNPLIRALRFTTLGVKAGIRQKISFRSIQSQATDTAYASDFKLELAGSAGAGNDLQSFLRALNIVTSPLELFNISSLLAESPKGTLRISPPRVKPGNSVELGDSATFTVTLNPTTYLGSYNVEEVKIYWLRDGTMESGRPGCHTLAASPNQREFSCSARFLLEHIGQQKFFAFVKASLFGLSLPILLEVGPNSVATVNVTNVPAKIAFLRTHGDTRDIFTIKPDGTEERNITNTPDNRELYPNWSPDGLRITYVQTAAHSNVYLIDADGSNPTPVTSGEFNDYKHPSWSPDGQKIAYYSDNLGGVLVTAVDGTAPILVENTFTTGPVSWSPDSSRIVVGDYDGTVVSVSSIGSGRSSLAAGYSPDWSADGSRVAFIRSIPFVEKTVWTVAANGTDEIQITENILGLDRVSWSPDGSTILISNQTDIFTVSPDGSGFANLTDQDRIHTATDPVWGPEGARIAFTGFSFDGSVHEPDGVYVMDKDGTNLRRITPDSTGIRQPVAWSR